MVLDELLKRRPYRDNPRFSYLKRWSNKLRGYYGVPIYLCGSALYKPNPRDWDVRVHLTDLAFRKHFGDPTAWLAEGYSGAWTDVRWRWADQCVRESFQGFAETGLNIDFQIYPTKRWRDYHGRPRLRLDTYKKPKPI